MKHNVTIGIDMGGTNTAFGFVDRDGNVYAQGNISTTKYRELNLYMVELENAIRAAWDEVADSINVVGIGVGAPSGNYLTRHIEESANLPWEGRVPFCSLLEEYFKEIPAFITNDANAATIGEMVYGGAKGMKDFVMVTLGTGVGSGYVSNGRLIFGSNGLAGELGHVIVTSNGRECGCGRQGCLETYCSANGVRRTAFELMASSTIPSKLRDVPFNEMTSKTVCDAALAGDPLAIKVFNITGEILGKALANTVTITGPEAIFLMGGLTHAGELLFEPTRQAMNKNMMFLFENSVKLLPSAIDGNVAILGAAALAWSEL